MVSDEALYRRLLDGEAHAFDELYRRYERCLFGFVLRQLGDRSEAEDVFHEAFMAVLHERRSSRDLVSFKAWIFEVARHLCLNRVRSRKRAVRALETEALTPAAAQPHPESILASREAPAALQRAVEKLPETLAQLYDLRTSGLSYDEIAEVLDVPLGTVKSRMHEMVGRLREEIAPWTAT
jgi:RNA polymerase sigma-70 factor (ECF subfamily)